MTARARRSTASIALAIALLAPSFAFAAGTEIPDNGASVLGRGGTSIGLLDTAYSLQFNPAGMSRVKGLDVRVDVRMTNHDVSFKRADFDGLKFDRVHNSAGLNVVPMAMIVYTPEVEGLLGRFSFGLGAWAPPGLKTYSFPDHRDARGFKDEPEANYADAAGQRYTLIDSDITIFYPSVGVSFRALDNLSFGITLQAAYANIVNSQAMALLDPKASPLFAENSEDTFYDAIVGLNMTDAFTPTAILGVAYEPIRGLTLGASFRPQINFDASGPLSLDFPEGNSVVESAVEVLTEKPTARLQLRFPAVLRAGASYRWKGFNVAGEFHYQRWSGNRKFVLTPDVELMVKMPGEEEEKMILDPITIPKHWKDSYGGRLGLSYEIFPVAPKKFSLEVHAGGVFESNAIPSEYQQVDFVTGDRLGGSLGATIGWDRFALTVAGMVYAPVSIDVTDSKLERAIAMPENDPVIIGNGNYTSDLWLLSVGLAYRGFSL